MPSHRKERVPRHGAQRRTENPSRRAWLDAAVPAPNPALETPQPVISPSQPALETQWSAFVAAAEADLSPTVPIMLAIPGMLASVSRADPVLITSHDAAHDGAVIEGTVPDGISADGISADGAARYDPEPGAPALRPAPRPPGPSLGWRVRRVVRGLLMTPWFAASTGFVIAVGMWLYSPHASITFPSAIGTIHCRLHGCVTQGGNSSGSVASSAPGQRLRTRHVGRGSEQSAAAAKRTAGLAFTFTVLWRSDQSFGVAISISGRRSLGTWQLAFRLPGTQIQNVFGAEWLQSASEDGGTASPFHADFGPAPDTDAVTFRVDGTGSLSAPTSCTFDGARCTFTVTSAGKDGAPSSGSYGVGGHSRAASQSRGGG
jgi:Cellulose binding domain